MEIKAWSDCLARRINSDFVSSTNIALVQECESTMPLAREIHKGQQEKTLKWLNFSENARFLWCYALSQTSGKGRQGRDWYSNPGQGMYLSILTYFTYGYQDISGLSLMIGTSIARALKSMGLSPELKWPNDVLVSRKKIAGILVETFPSKEDTSRCHLNVGIGLNILHQEFPKDLQATSVQLELGREVSYQNVCLEVAKVVSEDLLKFKEERFGGFIDEWRELSIMKGAMVRKRDGEMLGVVKDIDESGALLVESGDVVTQIVGYDDELSYEVRSQ